MPAKLIRDLLRCGRLDPVDIRDKVRQRFSCNIRWGGRDIEAYLGGQWLQFCSTNGLIRGRTEILGIDEDNFKFWHATF